MQSVGVMLCVALLSFSLFNFVGDPINNMVGEETSNEERAELRETLGLNDPIHIQFGRFVVNAAQFNFGKSYQLRRPVSELIAERMPANAGAGDRFQHSGAQFWGVSRRLYRD